MMQDERFIFGDLNKESFKEIWKKVPKKIKVIPSCQNCCKNHEINRALYKAKKLEHVEFL